MSTGDEMADRWMASVRSSLGSRKSAAMTADLELVEMVVRSLCKVFGEHYDYVNETTEYTGKVLRAIAEPVPRYGWVPLNPGEWDANRLTPMVPPWQMNGVKDE